MDYLAPLAHIYSVAVPITLLVCLGATLWWAYAESRRRTRKVDHIMRRWPAKKDETP